MSNIVLEGVLEGAENAELAGANWGPLVARMQEKMKARQKAEAEAKAKAQQLAEARAKAQKQAQEQPTGKGKIILPRWRGMLGKGNGRFNPRRPINPRWRPNGPARLHFQRWGNRQAEELGELGEAFTPAPLATTAQNAAIFASLPATLPKAAPASSGGNWFTNLLDSGAKLLNITGSAANQVVSTAAQLRAQKAGLQYNMYNGGLSTFNPYAPPSFMDQEMIPGLKNSMLLLFGALGLGAVVLLKKRPA